MRLAMLGSMLFSWKQFPGCDLSPDEARAGMQLKSVEGHLGNLLILNVALQLFDGIATYQGIQVGFREGNPLLLAVFAKIGVGPGLLLFKAKACALLLLVHQTAPPRLGVPVLRMLAAVYCVLSLGPWLAMFVGLGLGMV
jgi:hypothetical protein